MYCRYCGAEVDDDFVFCSRCGKRIGKTTAESSSKTSGKHRSHLVEMHGESSEQVQRLVMVDLPVALPPQALAGPPVEQIVHPLDLVVGHGVEACVLGEPIPQEPVGVLVGPPLPRVVGAAEVDWGAQRLLEALRIRELLPLSSVTVRTGSPARARSVVALTSRWAFLAALPPAR